MPKQRNPQPTRTALASSKVTEVDLDVSTSVEAGDLVYRMRAASGLAALLAEAEATWHMRAAKSGELADNGKPAWRMFEDAFPTFYEFTNRPR